MKTRALIIGGFHKARSLAYLLINRGIDVTVINNSRENCEILANTKNLNVIYGDGTKQYVLDEAEACNVDIAIAMSSRDDVNLIACELCKKLYHVKRVVSIVNDSRKSQLFYDMGVDSVVCATDTVATIIEQQLFLDKIAMSVPLSLGDVEVLELKVTKNALAVGKAIKDLNLPKNIIISYILRQDNGIIPNGNTIIEANDFLIIIADKKNSVIKYFVEK